jgi:SAM-dependent MidA family methyltransferase
MTHTPLQQLIIERIRREGPLPFAEYMRLALYAPGYGYYVSGPARMGWQGDYFTSSDVPVFFAHCLGRQLRQWWEKLGGPARFGVLEQGAGRGSLAHEVLQWARLADAAFYAALDYAVEDMRSGQDVRQAWSQGGAPEPAVILSNELIDAFPVHIVEVRDARLHEVYVDVEGERLCEILAEPSSPEVGGYLDSFAIPWTAFGDGWRAEINLDALRWMQGTARRLRRGYILTIDYGDKARALYTRRRRRGTLACYFQHRLNERPLLRSGEQDITAHVNFSALIAEGRRQGLRLHAFTTQRLWLEEMGIGRELEQLRSSQFGAADSERASDKGQVALLQWSNLRQQAALLTDPAGMGNFKLLALRR